MWDVDNSASRQVLIIGSGREGDGIVEGAAAWFERDVVRKWNEHEGKRTHRMFSVPPAIGCPSAFLPRPQSNALSDPGGELSGQP